MVVKTFGYSQVEDRASCGRELTDQCYHLLSREAIEHIGVDGRLADCRDIVLDLDQFQAVVATQVVECGVYGNAAAPTLERSLATKLADAGEDRDKAVVQQIFGLGAIGHITAQHAKYES